MAIFEWTGNAEAVAQIDEITPTPGAGTFTITVNNKNVSYVATGTPTAQEIVDGLVAAWNGSPYPETNDAVATASATPTVLLTSTIPGWPFTVSVSVANLTLANNQAASGPNYWGQAENYVNLSAGGGTGVPAATDEVHIREDRPPILHNLNALSAVALQNMFIDAPMTGEIGLAKTNPRGYVEYRPTKLQLNCSGEVWIGRGNGPGSPRIVLDMMGSGADVTIIKTGQSTVIDTRPVQIDNADGTAAKLRIRNGSVDINRESASKGGFADVQITGGECRVWPDFNVTPAQTGTLTVTQSGRLILGAGGNVTAAGGTLDLFDTATPGTLTINGPAVVNSQLKSTIATLLLDHPNAVLDFSASPHLATFTAWTIRRGQIRDPNNVVNWTSGGGVLPGGNMTFSET